MSNTRARDKQPTCKHCRERESAYGKRGLCTPCYRTPAVLSMYPAAPPSSRNDMTDAELNALIEQQKATMPQTNSQARP